MYSKLQTVKALRQCCQGGTKEKGTNHLLLQDHRQRCGLLVVQSHGCGRKILTISNCVRETKLIYSTKQPLYFMCYWVMESGNDH